MAHGGALLFLDHMGQSSRTHGYIRTSFEDRFQTQTQKAVSWQAAGGGFSDKALLDGMSVCLNSWQSAVNPFSNDQFQTLPN